jgi:hypothetical protein
MAGLTVPYFASVTHVHQLRLIVLARASKRR